MAIHYRTLGFVLKKQNLGEADQILTIYTQDFGKLEILGKAIRKIKSKLRGGTREFSLSEIEFIQGKNYKTLTDALIIELFENLKDNFKKLTIIRQISEISDNFLKDEEKDESIWELLNETFRKLNTSKLKPITSSLIYYYFLWNFLSILGYQPQLNNCVLCQKRITPNKLKFSFQEGGIVCQDCSLKTFEQIDPDTIKILRLFLKKDWKTLNKLKLESRHLKSLKDISNNYLTHFLNHIR
ncbi:DNA repair protein RecO [Patescibacteria group bacterium]